MKRLKPLLLLILIGLTSSVFAKKDAVRATIKGIGNDTIFVQYGPVSKLYEMQEPLLDTIYSKKDKFTFNLPAPYSTDTMLVLFYPTSGDRKRLNGNTYHPVQNLILLVLLPGEQLNLKGTLTDYYLDYQVAGSRLNEDYSKLRSRFIQQGGESVKIEMQLDSVLSKEGERDQEMINQLLEKRNEKLQPEKTAQMQFIKENPGNQLSGFYLINQPLDTVALYADKLSQEVRTGIFKHPIDFMFERIQQSKQETAVEKGLTVGDQAPDFTLMSIKGEPLTLSAVKKKYVVLDFWGSWCSWCIKGIPDMKKYYEKYSNQLEIIGIDCRDTEEAWKKAVEENELKWLHVINSTEPDQDVTVKYGIRGYPTKIILNENKQIIAVVLGESEEFYQKLDELMGN